MKIAAALIVGLVYGWYWGRTDFQSPHMWQ